MSNDLLLILSTKKEKLFFEENCKNSLKTTKNKGFLSVKNIQITHNQRIYGSKVCYLNQFKTRTKQFKIQAEFKKKERNDSFIFIALYFLLQFLCQKP